MNNRIFIIIIAVVVLGFLGLVLSSSDDAPQPNPDDAQPTNITEGSDNYYGLKDSPVVLIEAYSLACPGCGSYHPTLKELREEYKDRIKFQVLHYPLTAKSGFKNALFAHKVVEAARQQGQDKFWAMHDKLFETQATWVESQSPTDQFKTFAEEIELDIDQFEADRKSAKINDIITKDENYLREKFDVSNTPTFILNDEVIDHGQLSTNIDAWRNLLDQALSESSQATESLTGTITYDNSEALPTGSTLTVRLLDTSNQDVSSITISEIKITTNLEQVPIEFELAYSPEDIEPQNTYNATAEIRDEAGNLLFISETAYNVLTNNNPQQIDIELITIS